MAPPTRSVPRPWRALAALGVIILIMLISITGKQTFSPGKWSQDFRVGLGLDLSSGTQATLVAKTPNGSPPSAADMSEAINIMNSRVNSTGNTGAQTQQQGTNMINISVPNSTGTQAQQLIKLATTTAQLIFRPVLLEQPYGVTTTPTPTPKASSSSTPKASSSASPTAQPSATSTATTKATTKAKIVKDAATPTPTASAKPSSTASANASASATPSPAPTASAAPATAYSGNKSAVSAAVFSKFEKLKCVPSSSPTTVNDSWKKSVGYTDSSDWNDPNAQIVSCDSNGYKYVLGKAVVMGKNVKSATAGLNQSAQWIVNITLDGPAVKAFGDLTTNQYNNYYPSVSTNADDAVLDNIGIVLDGDVVEAPQTQGALTTGQFQISNGTAGFTEAQATYIQNVLKYGALPLTFDVTQNVTVSPQLARTSLDAGLIAAAIGLALVVLYSFFYYRGLGIVSVSSLVIAALMAYLAVVLLTKYQGFTMELSGIAGLIVAIGITADSFVVFFERLRDEVRDGKALRPAVESGWKRARRTVLVSDTVSFLAALVLYELAIGEVRGFAYTLGLTTIIDVVVVFLFTKPMVTVLARRKFFASGHPMSGLDPVRLGARTPWRSSVSRAATRTTARGSARTRTTPTDLGEA